jgi:hypothetical protein
MAVTAPPRAPLKADPKTPAGDTYAVIATGLDGAFYRAMNPDLGASVDPVRHYISSGWREDRDPAPWFSSHAYVKAYPEVAKAGWNPLHHYLAVGRYEGREVVRSRLSNDYLLRRARRGEEPAWSFESLTDGVQAPDALAEETALRHRERTLAATEFDAAYYLAVNGDVAETGVDPLDHFLASGWREGRDPNAAFSVKDYLENYPDIAAADVNPFVHFLSAGRAEGRAAKVDLGFRYEIIKRLVPLETRVAAVARASAKVKLGTAAALGKALAGARTGLVDLHVTFSHDDYTANTGGVQLCLQREDARVEALGRDHLHLYPAKPWPVVRLRAEAGHLGVLLNGQDAGVYAPKTIVAALARGAGAKKAGRRSFAIHSLLGHNAAETADILAAAGLKTGYFWLHDFASLCAGFHLLRDDVEDCAAPPPTSAACGVCIYGPWRARHLAEHERLFRKLALTVVSPSQPTLDLWRAAWPFPTKDEIVLPHARLVERGPAPIPRGARPLRVAFVGLPAAHKGWPVFRDLALRFADDPRYEFIHFGLRAVGGRSVGFEPVRVTAEKPNAMQQALETAAVDAVLVWPLCRETFSFTAYEAVAAGAAVLTNADSGNVAAFVQGGGHGRVLADEAQLHELLASGEILALSRAARKASLYELKFSGLTVELIEKARAA